MNGVSSKAPEGGEWLQEGWPVLFTRKLQASHLATQDLLAEPEERRSFMDMRLLLVRGDIGEAKSVPSTCAVAAAGVSPG